MNNPEKLEPVRVFNLELSGLYDSKPPISKAKMSSITRSAMKAIKFYKHVVQSVEKFILKCKPEYKIPGLYVIDSIVRQSRHQFGADKDVFAPRFARNMESTFANLFRCAPEDKSKIIRVLNLWQKNNVFAPEVIQPIFDLANPDHPIHQQNQSAQEAALMSNGLLSDSPNLNQTDDVNMHDSGIVMNNKMDPTKLRQLQQYQQMLLRQNNAEPNTSNSLSKDSVKFNKNLLDYDYGSDEDDDKNNSPHISNNLMPDGGNFAQLLSDPNVLKQLQNLQKLKNEEQKQNKMAEMRLKEEAFEKHLASRIKQLPFASECDLSRQGQNDMQMQTGVPNHMLYNATASLNLANINSLLANNAGVTDQNESEVEFIGDDRKIEIVNLAGNDSRSPSPRSDRYKRRKSRSRSRDRRDRRRRSRSRSRSRSYTRSPRSRRRTSRDRLKDKEREREREHERERRRRGLPDIRKEHLSVCSTTLWVGHLSKLVQQEELSDTFGKYGDIVSIDMIPPRGCAFIVMNRRQDAFKSMQNLKNQKMQGRAITISWAAGKGVKSKEWKDYWDIDLGVSYIPWNKINQLTDFEALEEGGMFDEDSMPQWIKDKINSKTKTDETLKLENTSNLLATMFGMPDVSTVDTSQPPPTSSLLPGVSMVSQFALGGMPRLMGIPMPPNLLSMGVPPPGMMMPNPAGLNISGMPPMPPIDKSIPPPLNPPQTFAAMQGIPPPPPHISNTVMNDDQMDIEMDDETSTTGSIAMNDKVNKFQEQLLGYFNHPPPQILGAGGTGSSSADNDKGGRDRHRDHSRGEINDRRNNRDREKPDVRDRGDGRRGDYGGNRNDRDRERNQRWNGSKGSENRDRDSYNRDRDVNSKEREKTLQDRLRDLANVGNQLNRNEYPREGRRSLLDLQLSDSESTPMFNARGGGGTGGFNDGINTSRTLQRQPPLSLLPDDRQRDFNRSDDYDRRGFMQNRFESSSGSRNSNAMGSGRSGSSMYGGPRVGPMFMRGGPRPGFNYNNERSAYYERDMPFNDDRDGNRNSRNNWSNNNSTDSRKRQSSSWRDDDRRYNRNEGGNKTINSNKKNSRWGNNSPGDNNNEENNSYHQNNKNDTEENSSNNAKQVEDNNDNENQRDSTHNDYQKNENSNNEIISVEHNMNNSAENSEHNFNNDSVGDNEINTNCDNICAQNNDSAEMYDNMQNNESLNKEDDEEEVIDNRNINKLQSNINSNNNNNKDNENMSNTTPLYDELQDMNDDQNKEKDNNDVITNNHSLTDENSCS